MNKAVVSVNPRKLQKKAESRFVASNSSSLQTQIYLKIEFNLAELWFSNEYESVAMPIQTDSQSK